MPAIDKSAHCLHIHNLELSEDAGNHWLDGKSCRERCNEYSTVE